MGFQAECGKKGVGKRTGQPARAEWTGHTSSRHSVFIISTFPTGYMLFWACNINALCKPSLMSIGRRHRTVCSISRVVLVEEWTTVVFSCSVIPDACPCLRPCCGVDEPLAKAQWDLVPKVMPRESCYHKWVTPSLWLQRNSRKGDPGVFAGWTTWNHQYPTHVTCTMTFYVVQLIDDP